VTMTSALDVAVDVTVELLFAAFGSVATEALAVLVTVPVVTVGLSAHVLVIVTV